MAVKRERMSPPLPLSVKEEPSRECPAAADETFSHDSEVGNESSDTETGDVTEQKPLSHQQAMEHFKDALAEIIVVCNCPIDVDRLGQLYC